MTPAIPRTGSEQAFQRAVVRLFESYGYRVSHNPDSRRSTMSGIPDLTCFHRQTKTIVVMELKTESGKPTNEQLFTIECYHKVGVYAGIVRPSDIPSGLLEKVARHYAFHEGDKNDCSICTDN